MSRRGRQESHYLIAGNGREVVISVHIDRRRDRAGIRSWFDGRPVMAHAYKSIARAREVARETMADSPGSFWAKRPPALNFG